MEPMSSIIKELQYENTNYIIPYQSRSIHNIHIPKVYMHKMLAFPFDSKLKFCLIDSGKIIFIEKCVCVNVY